MATIQIRNRVYVRDQFGQFAERAGEAVDEALAEAARVGRDTSAAAEPKLADTFKTETYGKALHGWGSTHPWAQGLNDGIPQHAIAPGEKGVLAGRAGQRHREEDFFSRQPVRHPGVKPRRFMEAGYSRVRALMPAILRRHRVKTR
jgi:hypothetical protein